MGTCSSERLENVLRVTKAQWTAQHTHCLPGLGTLPAGYSCRCLRQRQVYSQVHTLLFRWATSRLKAETRLQGQEFAFWVFWCPHPLSASIHIHTALGETKPSHPHSHSRTDGKLPEGKIPACLKLHYSGKGPEASWQCEPDKTTFKSHSV